MKFINKNIAAAYTFAVFVVLIIPPGIFGADTGTINIKFPDKIIHFILFLFIEIVWLTAYNIHKAQTRKIFIISIFGILFGTLTEALQHFLIYGRNGSFYDVIADLSGIIFGAGVYLILKNNS